MLVLSSTNLNRPARRRNSRDLYYAPRATLSNTYSQPSDCLSSIKPIMPSPELKKKTRMSLHQKSRLLPLLIVLITQPTVFATRGVTVEGTCQSASGIPICCQGKQVNCYGYQQEYANITKGYRQKLLSMKSVLKTSKSTCFCDEHCTKTKDCCPDYRSVCQKPAYDCIVSEWSDWGACSRQCGHGWTTRSRQVVKPEQNGGQHCPVLEEKKRCGNFNCMTRRVSRSGTLTLPLVGQAQTEVAHLLPLRGDVLRMTRRYDMRWDVRRKLYLGRLIKQNKTEKVDPDPYCAVYEITHTNQACRLQSLMYQMQESRKRRIQRSPAYDSPYSGSVFTFSRQPANNPSDPPYAETPWRSQYYDSNFDSANSARLANDWGISDTWSYSWMSHTPLLMEGHRICVTCYPAYMREDLGYRCTGTGLLNYETRWRALRTTDCHGRLRMIRMPRRACTCSDEAASFIFV